MKLKDLIGIIPDEEGVWINNEKCSDFCKVPFSTLNKEVRLINEANWGGIHIEVYD